MHFYAKHKGVAAKREMLINLIAVLYIIKYKLQCIPSDIFSFHKFSINVFLTLLGIQIQALENCFFEVKKL